MKLVAYYRVSTQRQGQSGLGLEAQQAAVRGYAERCGYTIVAEFTEVESGRKCDRPQLASALAQAKAEGATLVVAKLDRLARDARFLLSLADGGVGLHFLDLPDLSCHTAVGRMIFTIMASVAEFESRRISERIKAALAARRARGTVSEPKRFSAEHQRGAVAAWHAQNRAGRDRFRVAHRPLAAALRRGRSLNEVAAELNRLGVPTRRGKKWTPGLVWWLLK